MRCYTALDEHRVRAQTAVRSWYQGGRISLEQADRMCHDVRVNLARTNDVFRVGLGAFVLFVVGAALAFAVSFLRPDTALQGAIITLAIGVVCVAGAAALVQIERFYRHGVEEALVIAGIVLAGVTAGLIYLNFASPLERQGLHAVTAGLAVGGAAAVLAYLRFGYVYAAIAAVAFVAAMPFTFTLSPAYERALAAAVFLSAVLVVRPLRLRYQDVWPGDEYGQIQAVAWLGMYAALNVKIGVDSIVGPFYWFTYVMTFAIPVAGLVLGIRHKDRALINVNIVAAIVTLITNKPYLHWERHEWDPILLGVVLIGVTVWLRRWLSSAAGGHRAGFTVTPVKAEQSPLLAVVSAVPFGTIAHATHAPAPHVPPKDFDGGRSGGGDSGF
jgi:MFS family permease